MRKHSEPAGNPGLQARASKGGQWWGGEGENLHLWPSVNRRTHSARTSGCPRGHPADVDLDPDTLNTQKFFRLALGGSSFLCSPTVKLAALTPGCPHPLSTAGASAQPGINTTHIVRLQGLHGCLLFYVGDSRRRIKDIIRGIFTSRPDK